MKKTFLFGAIAMAMGFGCAITNYSLITDNDIGGGAVNTNGKATIRQSSQVATTYPDGSDNLQWFVDQNQAGDRVLTTYNFFTTSGSPFRDDLYCSPDKTGCAVVTAQDPEVGDADIFDYSWNQNCTGSRSLSLLLSTSRYYGECGRANGDRMQKALSLVSQMTPETINGKTWLKGVLNSTNTTYILNNHNGASAAFAPAGDITVLFNGSQRRAQIGMQNPVTRQSLQAVRGWLTSHPGPYVTVNRVVNGVSMSNDMKILTTQMGRFIDAHY
jgi:hypothetical protein